MLNFIKGIYSIKYNFIFWNLYCRKLVSRDSNVKSRVFLVILVISVVLLDFVNKILEYYYIFKIRLLVNEVFVIIICIYIMLCINIK